MLEDTRLAGIRAKPVLCGSFVWNRGRIVRGNWLDGLRVSKNGTNGQRAGRGHRACYVVGHLAHSGDRLFGNGDAAWRALARVFPGVYGGDDRDARADCLDFREHEDRKSTRLNSSHGYNSYAVFCLKKKKKIHIDKRSC